MNDRSNTMEAEGYALKKTKTLFTNTGCLHKTPSLNDVVNNLFNKHFSIAKNECYSLPKESTMFKESVWQVNELQKLKTELNSVKNCLNDYDHAKWQMHTKLRNSAKDVMKRLKNNIEPELLTQAWCKFYEIVSSFPVVPVDHIRNNNKRFKSIHLCEAPGAFVTSLNHWLQTNVSDFQWDWIATTLNPYYEGNSLSAMVDDDRFMRHTLNHWYFGEDNTGNLMNVKSLNEFLSIAEPCRDIFLVTADGSIDCSDVPAEQENALIHLHYCETVAALQLLATGGSFLLKIFTIFECNSICLLYLLSCSFANINLIKPATSKEGNSETYLICTNFKGLEFILPYLEKLKEHYEYGPKNAIFNREDIPCAFVEKVIQCSEFFKSQQCLVIKNNINTFTSDNSKALCDMKQIQRMVADKYIRNYNLKKLESGEIVGNLVILETTTNTNKYNKSLQGSYNERCAKQHLSFLDQIESFYNDTCNVQPYMLSTGDIKYIFHKLPQDLQIRSGKIFQRIYSSKFCSKRLLKILNHVDDILRKMEQKIQFPAIASIDKLKAMVSHKPGHEILVFRYTDTYDSHKIISDIYNVLQELDSGATLVLIGYSLLTHLSIGLLYLVGCTFNSVKITACNDMGLKITLHHYNYNLRTLKFLNEIKAASIEALKEEKAIVEIISPPVLYKGCEDLCSSSEDLNHWVIKTYILSIRFTTMKFGTIYSCTRLFSSGQIIPKVCIIGAGPAGFYAAQQLLKIASNMKVDILEKLPVPYGLVRFGVAPDHPEVKNVIHTFEKVATNPRFQFIGNVNIGIDITVKELQELYHVVLLTYGAEKDKVLNIPGETLNNVISGRQFVGWYNGVPADRNLNINLDIEEAVVLGQGNVAIDIARILLTPINKLKSTDITSHALDKLSQSKVRKVTLVGRRGPLQAAFTIAELREILKLDGCRTCWRANDFVEVKEVVNTLARPRKRLTELMVKHLEEKPLRTETVTKELHPIFLRSPVKFLGSDSVNGVKLSINKLEGGNTSTQFAVSTESFEKISCGLVFRSIGYKSVQIDTSVPFDQRNGCVKNFAGKVEDKLYAAGWVATGPIGVIMSTMTNAFHVGSLIRKELSITETKSGSAGLSKILDQRGIPTVSYRGWEKIDKVERARGKAVGKPREKVVDINEMLEIALK